MSGAAKPLTMLVLAGAAILFAGSASADRDDGTRHHHDGYRVERDHHERYGDDGWSDGGDGYGWRHHRRPREQWICAGYNATLDGDDCHWGRESDHD
jgi:hypothetical protein